MTVVAPPPQRHDHTNEAQLLFKEAKQRRRRRLRIIWVSVVLAIAVVGCAVGFALGFNDSSPPATQPHSLGTQPLPGHVPTGATLVYAFNDLRVIDADTGATRILPMPAPYGGSRDLAMARVGTSLLLNRGNTAWLYADGFTGSPTDLGPSDGVFPGPNHNEAWIWSQPCQPLFGCADYGDLPQMGSVRLVDSSGQTIGSPVQLPGGAGWYPTGLAGEPGIVLAQSPPYGNAEEIWNPLTERVVRFFSNAQVIAEADNHVVSESSRYRCGESTACSLRLTNLKAGTDKTVLLPKGVAVVGGAAFSPDHHTLALAVALRPGRTPSRAPHHEAIALIDVPTGNATILEGSRQSTNSHYTMSLTWSTNGWLLFSDTVESSVAFYGFSDTVGSSAVRVWHPGERRAWVLPRVRVPKAQFSNEDPSLIAL
jgi:hypothetical protein